MTLRRHALVAILVVTGVLAGIAHQGGTPPGLSAGTSHMQLAADNPPYPPFP